MSRYHNGYPWLFLASHVLMSVSVDEILHLIMFKYVNLTDVKL